MGEKKYLLSVDVKVFIRIMLIYVSFRKEYLENILPKRVHFARPLTQKLTWIGVLKFISYECSYS